VNEARHFDADMVFVVGGGKAIDAGKVAAEHLFLPIVVIPTIAATCAAVSSVSILYDENGHYDDMHYLAKAPDIVVLDSHIIAQSPVRWLAAGLGDTLAKFYEYRVVSGGHPDFSLNMAAYTNGLLCFDIIKRYGAQAVKDVENNQSGAALEQVMDAIFTFAGLTSVMGVGEHVAAAHALFEGFTVVDKTRHFGHGLLVGFGNLCLLALEGRSESEIIDAIMLAKECLVPTSLDEIAILTEDELMQIATQAVHTADMDNMQTKIDVEQLIDAMNFVSTLSLTH